MCSTCQSTYSVLGMTCGGCANKVKDALLGIETVTDVTVDVSTGAVSITGEVSEEQVRNAVEAVGYQLA